MNIRKLYLLIILIVVAGLTLWVGHLRSPTGAFSMVDVAPAGFAMEANLDANMEEASQALETAREDIEEMKKYNFITLFAEDTLQEAEGAYEDKNYSKVVQLTNLIAFVKKEKIDFFDRVRLIEIKKQTLQDKGVDDFEHVNSMMHDGMNAFSLDQLDDANQMLDKADDELRTMSKEKSRVTRITTGSKNFFIRFWIELLVLVIVLGFITPPLFKYLNKKRLRAKIANAKLDLKKTKDLIKKLQKECFVDRSITSDTYKESVAKFEEKITELKHSIPVLKARLHGGKKKRTVRGILKLK